MLDHIDELLNELKSISPMPDDKSASEEVLKTFANIVDGLAEVRDPRIIEPLVYSFGYGSGYGLCWDIVHLLEKFDSELLKPILTSALKRGQRGTRMWAAVLLGSMGDKSLLTPLMSLLDDPEELVRSHAVIAIARIGDPATRIRFESMRNDPSPNVRHAVTVALRDINNVSPS